MDMVLLVSGLLSYYSVFLYIRLRKKHLLSTLYLTGVFLPISIPAVYFFGNEVWKIVMYLLAILGFAFLINKFYCFRRIGLGS